MFEKLMQKQEKSLRDYFVIGLVAVVASIVATVIVGIVLIPISPLAILGIPGLILILGATLLLTVLFIGIALAIVFS